MAITEESGKIRNYTWDGSLLTEERDQKKNNVILRDRHQRDKKTSSEEGIKMITTQSVVNISDQGKMIMQSYHEAGIPPRRTDDIKRMLCRLIKEQSALDVGVE